MLARSGSLRRYRRGDVVLTQGATAADALLLLAGTLGSLVAKGDEEIRLELVGAGQLLVLHEMLVNGPSPVRIVAEKDADVLAIPSTAMVEALDSAQTLARGIDALMEARRHAILAAQRGVRKAA